MESKDVNGTLVELGLEKIDAGIVGDDLFCLVDVGVKKGVGGTYECFFDQG